MRTMEEAKVDEDEEFELKRPPYLHVCHSARVVDFACSRPS